MTRSDATREQLIATYRKKAKHFDLTSMLYPVPGYPHGLQRRRAVQALGLRAGATVVDIACGTGQNFALIEKAIGPGGRIIGVDMTDAMLARARNRAAMRGWTNVRLVHADVADFDFPTQIDAILSTYALTQVPECADVIAHGAAALRRSGRWAVLDLKMPDYTPRPVLRFGAAFVRRFAAIDEWIARRPWDAIRSAVEHELADPSWTELTFGTAFLAAGCGKRA